MEGSADRRTDTLTDGYTNSLKSRVTRWLKKLPAGLKALISSFMFFSKRILGHCLGRSCLFPVKRIPLTLFTRFMRKHKNFLKWTISPEYQLISRVLRDSAPRFVRPPHFTFFGCLRFLASPLLPKWSGDLNYGPCPPVRDWGSRVSDLVLYNG